MANLLPKPAPIVLVVNDIESKRDYFSLVLREAGFEVTEAATGVQSLLKLEPNPDVILLDINLPDISGYEICRQLKNSHLKNIPVIHTSASFISQIEAAKGVQSGADACLSSPVDARNLVDCVNNCLKKSKKI